MVAWDPRLSAKIWKSKLLQHTGILDVWQNCPQRSPNLGHWRNQGLIMMSWSPTAQEKELCQVYRELPMKICLSYPLIL